MGHTRRTALITGASRGIGAAIAKRFAEEGIDLILTCKNNTEKLSKYADELQNTYGISCTAVSCDMSDADEVATLFSTVSHLDILVNNAGIAHIGLLSDMTVDEWHNIIGTNLDSCFYTSKAAIPLMLQNHAGKIIQISSVWGEVGASMEVAYSASKGGVNAFTKALAKELAPSGIQVNAISCGVIDTEMNGQLDEEERASLAEEIPTDRFGLPEEVADLALHLVNGPDYLTGQIIRIDGGWI